MSVHKNIFSNIYRTYIHIFLWYEVCVPTLISSEDNQGYPNLDRYLQYLILLCHGKHQEKLSTHSVNCHMDLDNSQLESKLIEVRSTTNKRHGDGEAYSEMDLRNGGH